MGPARRFLLRFVSLFRSGRAERDLAREIDTHLRLLEDQFIAQGMSADEARYAARRAFGGVEQVKERQREERSFRWMHGASLDFKLGVRMLFKYPGLTVVGGASIALGIAVGAAAFEFMMQVVSPTPPLDGGDRIVRIRHWDSDANREEPRLMHDVLVWRQQLSLLEDVGAYRNVERNLIVDGIAGEPLEIAEISASAFRLARVRPLLGRVLVDQDERAGAAPVLVIGHDAWKRRFGGDPAVVGRSVRLGNTPAVVVGVMPEGFAFPVSHSAWTALSMDAAGYAPRSTLTGPAVEVFGRLAPGATLREAEAQIEAVGAREATRFPQTHARLRPLVGPYATARSGVDDTGMAAAAFNAFVVLFVVLICANVAALVLARAASRESEILVRSAVRPVIVNRAFVSQVLGGANPLGRRLRSVNPRDPKPQPWHEIVGVVRDLGMIGGDAGDIGAGIYHPATPGTMAPVHVALRINGDSDAFAPRLRAIAAAIDPALRLHEVQRLDKAGASLWLESQFLYRVLIIVSAVALLLSLTGIYSILAFTVSRRTREIGIRIALGADARRIVFAIFSRAIAQVAIGVALGGGLVFALTKFINGLAAKEILAVSGYMAAMMAVCLLACLVPTRRALAVEPTEALRTE